MDLGPLNVVTGPNGCGKSNLYRAVWLLHQAAAGGFARTLAEEGGMPSALWAGERKRGPVRLSLGVHLSDGFAYSLEAGLPEPNDLPRGRGYFSLDPLIKSETVTYSGSTLCERSKSGVVLRDDSGKRVSMPMSLTRGESILTQLAEPHRYPYLVALRHHLSSWRFYHGFRTDADSPLRQPQVGVFTPTLAHDGRDLAAAFATIFELGEEEEVQSAVPWAVRLWWWRMRQSKHVFGYSLLYRVCSAGWNLLSFPMAACASSVSPPPSCRPASPRYSRLMNLRPACIRIY